VIDCCAITEMKFERQYLNSQYQQTEDNTLPISFSGIFLIDLPQRNIFPMAATILR